jgi:hypothetical protein
VGRAILPAAAFSGGFRGIFAGKFQIPADKEE